MQAFWNKKKISTVEKNPDLKIDYLSLKRVLH